MRLIRRLECEFLLMGTVFLWAGVASTQINSAKQPDDTTLAQPSDSHVVSESQPGIQRDDSGKEAAETARTSSDRDSSGSSDRKTHFRLGTVSVGAGYSGFFVPSVYPYGPYGFYPYDAMYSGLLWSPIWGPYYGPQYLSYGNGKGEVRLAAEPKDAAVYLDGAYAGTANRLKTIWLDPGAYNLSVSATGREPFQQRIYVLSGKTLKLAAKLAYRIKP